MAARDPPEFASDKRSGRQAPPERTVRSLWQRLTGQGGRPRVEVFTGEASPFPNRRKESQESRIMLTPARIRRFQARVSTNATWSPT